MVPSPLSGPEAQQLMKNPAQLKALLSSPETKRLIALLREKGDLSRAAGAAKDGDPSALQRLLTDLQQDPRGADALNRMEQKLKR